MNPDPTPTTPQKTHRSFAQWPKGTLNYCSDQISTDDHWSEDEAKGVCQILHKNGFGGYKKVFPVKTWVEPIGRTEVQEQPAPTTPPTLREAVLGLLEQLRATLAINKYSPDFFDRLISVSNARLALAQPDPAEELVKHKELARSSAALNKKMLLTHESLSARITQLERENARLQSLLDIEQRNAPFYKALANDYEKALGPDAAHPNGGCWVIRTEAIRQESDRLRADVAELVGELKDTLHKLGTIKGHLNDYLNQKWVQIPRQEVSDLGERLLKFLAKHRK